MNANSENKVTTAAAATSGTWQTLWSGSRVFTASGNFTVPSIQTKGAVRISASVKFEVFTYDSYSGSENFYTESAIMNGKVLPAYVDRHSANVCFSRNGNNLSCKFNPYAEDFKGFYTEATPVEVIITKIEQEVPEEQPVPTGYGDLNLSFSDYGDNPKYNLATQRLLYTQPDTSIGGNSYTVGLSHVYDSQMRSALMAKTVGMPYGWKLDGHQFLVEDGTDENGAATYKYIDGAGYVHTFARTDNSVTRYADTDGLGLILDRSNAGSPYILDAQENKLIFQNERLTEKVSCHGSSMIKKYVYDSSGRLTEVYDNRKSSNKLVLSYAASGGLLDSITAKQGTAVLHTIEYEYDGSNRLISVKKTVGGSSKTICSYEYDMNGKLSSIVDEVRKSAIKITHMYTSINKDYTVMKIVYGIIGEDGVFIEKTHLTSWKTYVRLSDLTTYRELQFINEKDMLLSVQINGKGHIISTFECDRWTENLTTLTKDTGIPVELAGTSGNRSINGKISESFTGSISLPGVSLSRTGENNRYYNCRFWLRHTGLTKRLRARLSYTLNNNAGTYTSETEIDADAYDSWQQVSIPVDIRSSSNAISSMTLTLVAPGSASVSAKICNVRMIPTGRTAVYLNACAPVDFDTCTKYKITKVNPSTGTETTATVNMDINNPIYFTQGDLEQTVYNRRKTYTTQGKTCFDVVCNGGRKRISNVSSLKFICGSDNSETELGYGSFGTFYNMNGPQIVGALHLNHSLNDNVSGIIVPKFRNELFAKIYSEVSAAQLADYVVVSKSPDDKAETLRYICADNDRIGTMMISVISTNKDTMLSDVGLEYTKFSANASFADYKGRKVLDVDVYGVKTRYEYHSDGSAKKTVVTGTDGKQTVIAATETDTSAEYITAAHSGYDSSGFTYKQPYHLVDTETINGYNFSSDTYSANANSNYKYTYDAFNETAVKVEAFTGSTRNGYNEITYENGRIRTVNDGKSKYGVKYDAADDAITFTVFGDGSESPVQKHRTYVVDGVTTKSDTFYRGSGTDTVTAKLDKYGKLTQLTAASKVSTYTYENTGGESPAADTLSDVYDPYEKQTYTYHYDHDYNPTGYSAPHMSVLRLSATDTKYTFGSNEKYMTRVVYDDSVTMEPRITGTQIYIDGDGNIDDNFGESDKFSWKYYYDAMGRVSSKANKNDSLPDGKYTYTYKTSGTRTLPMLDTYKYVGSYYAISEYVKYDYGFEYAACGMPSKITESFTMQHGFNGSDPLHTALRNRMSYQRDREFTYDAFGRVLTEKLTNNGSVTNYTYKYYAEGRPERIDYGNGDVRKFGHDSRGYRNRSFYYNGMSLMALASYWYTYDGYGNRIRRSYVLGNGEAEGSTIYNYNWTRGSCLASIKRGDNTTSVAAYTYDRNGVRCEKVTAEGTTKYYTDGNKILGEDRPGNKKLRYFYDADGVCGFRYYDGSEWKVYTYVRDAMGSIVMIKDEEGYAIVRYTYDHFGKADLVALDTRKLSEYTGTVSSVLAQNDAPSLEIGNMNPFRWKGHYYDTECEESYYSGYYYIDGRYYDPNEGIYLDGEPMENMIANAERVFGLDRHSAAYDNIFSLSAYAYNIFTTEEYAKDPNADYTASGAVPWWSWLIAGVQLLAGFAMLFTPLAGAGIGLIAGGTMGILSNIFGSQLIGGIGMGISGVQGIITGIKLLAGACNPLATILGFAGIIAGISTSAFASAEIQEGLGYGNWIKDSGMSEGLYNGAKWVSYGVTLFVSIAGPIANKYGPKCFAAGTLVLTSAGYKAIEEIREGDLVLAYDEETGEQDYKEVIRLYRNETTEWYNIRINGEDIKCTAGHPFYVKEYDKFVAASELKIGETLLLSDGRCGIIQEIGIEIIPEPETTYNFEVADFHTYYVGANGVLVHNKCGEELRMSKEDAVDYGRRFLGDGFEKTGNGIYRSADGMRSMHYDFSHHPFRGKYYSGLNSPAHINLYVWKNPISHGVRNKLVKNIHIWFM